MTNAQVAVLVELADDLDRVVVEVSSRDGDATSRQHLRAESLRAALAALTAAEARAHTAEQARDEARSLHQELMFQVGKKYPGETRHETAKRYIQEHEHCGEGGPSQALASLTPKET